MRRPQGPARPGYKTRVADLTGTVVDVVELDAACPQCAGPQDRVTVRGDTTGQTNTVDTCTMIGCANNRFGLPIQMPAVIDA